MPDHLGEILEVFERIRRGERVRVTFSTPPRVGKSETIMHGLAQYIGEHQDKRNAYATYASDFARGQSRKIRRYVTGSGVPIDPSANRLEEWLTPFGGGLFATGVGGPLTGKGIDGIGVCDDLIKNREEAESARRREIVWEWFTDVFYSRLEGNASAIVVMTRWHPDDPIGRLRAEPGWQHINIPMVSVDPKTGERRALLPYYPGPEKRIAYPLEKCDEIRSIAGEYTWASLYQGNPIPKGGAVFEPPHLTRYALVPVEGAVSIGVDLAYTASTRSDYCVAVVLRRMKDGPIYVEHVERKQERAEDFVGTMEKLQRRFPGAPMIWHGSAQEKGAADVMAKLGLHGLQGELATADKFVRAQEVAAAWNRGDILIPADTPWTQEFLDEIKVFTGLGGGHDDQVDALASAFSGLGHGESPIETGGQQLRSIGAFDAL